MSTQLLLVEDDVVLRDNYADILADEGFDVHAFGNRRDAIAHFLHSASDLAILDIGLEDEREGGFQLCAELRNLSPTLPILFLTAHHDDFDKISALRLGADDYLTKDTSVDYLVVRIEALLRRFRTLATHTPRSGAAADHLVTGSLKIDQSRLVAIWKGHPLDLTLTQIWILQELAAHPGQVRTFMQLMRAAKLVVEPNTITAHVKAIRDRFKAIDSYFNCIRNERGAGYRWIEMPIN